MLSIPVYYFLIFYLVFVLFMIIMFWISTYHLHHTASLNFKSALLTIVTGLFILFIISATVGELLNRGLQNPGLQISADLFSVGY